MKYHPKLWSCYNYFRSFTNLRNAKNHLGYTFISNEDFLKLFKYHQTSRLVFRGYQSPLFTYRLINSNSKTKSLFEDYLKLSDKVGEYVIPTSFKHLRELHDDFVIKFNKSKIESKSSKIKFRPSDDKLGKPLNSQRELFKEGISQNHCIGGYLINNNNHYYNYKGYTFHITRGLENWKIAQCAGYRNKKVPNYNPIV